MPIGPGKYDELCSYVLEKSKARAAVVIIISGDRGPGMSVKEDFSLAGGRYHIERLPKVLRKIANEIEKSNGG